MLLSDHEEYKIILGDCIPTMAAMPAASVDFVICSVPFPAMYSYTSEEADVGNSEDRAEMKLHFGYFYRQLARVLKPGRVAAIHVMQIPRMKRTGGDGLFDFRGFNIRIGERAGLVYQYDWMIRKAPQAQAVRTKSHNLQFAGLERDRAQSRGALSDYLIKFRAKGENRVPIDSEDQVSRNQWIELAESCWTDIKETDTLNVREAKGEQDVKHLCALQLRLIEYGVRLFSNPNDIVFSPFAGVGSELFVALKLGRRAFGVELKPEYHAAALKNLARAVELRNESQRDLLALMGE